MDVTPMVRLRYFGTGLPRGHWQADSLSLAPSGQPLYMITNTENSTCNSDFLVLSESYSAIYVSIGL